MENRIQINGMWYVAENTFTPSKHETVDTLITKLQSWSNSGCGDFEVHIQFNNDMDNLSEVYSDGRKVILS
jgi:hypothetical protein